MPTNLQGLNVVRPPPQGPYLSDQQDLLTAPPFPDLAAQLDLWTNLSFSQDEPLASHDKNARAVVNDDDEDDYDEKDDVDSSPPSAISAPTTASADNGSNVDLSHFLSSFGVDPFAVPPQQQSAQGSPTLAQLLSLNPGHFAALASQFSGSQSSASAPAPTEQPPAKRARVRKASVSIPPSTPAPSSSTTATNASPQDSADLDGTSVAAAEDKRRRNTAASARFRLKKKEREAALERKAKDFETRVNELERECEALRRENGWLKGLVVGVTGAGVGPSGVQLTVTGAGTAAAAAPATGKNGAKRKREEEKAALAAQ